MTNKERFLKINNITLGSVLVLILVGSIVRSTGAGMGCPDWPKCFGSYIPPTSEDQLPDNYLDVFKAKRLAKNERLAGVFASLGYEETAGKITSDPAVLKEQQFNVTKAWIEYVNRLVGVLIGFLVFLNMIFAFRLRAGKWISIIGVLVLLLTGFQGWVGSLVVSTNLLKGFITFHMLMALLIVALLIWMNVKVKAKNPVRDNRLFSVATALFVLLIPQIVLGTEVRSVVDELLVSDTGRSEWLDSLTVVFIVHRSYSWVVLGGAGLLYYLAKRTETRELLPASAAFLGMVVLSAATGSVMANFAFPLWSQPIHLLLASGIFSVLFYLILRLRFT